MKYNEYREPTECDTCVWRYVGREKDKYINDLLKEIEVLKRGSNHSMTLPTEFGKACRNIRAERNELLIDMAEKINVSVSFLSAVENGKKKIPFPLVITLAKEYGLNETDTENLLRLANEERAILQDNINMGTPTEVELEGCMREFVKKGYKWFAEEREESGK